MYIKRINTCKMYCVNILSKLKKELRHSKQQVYTALQRRFRFGKLKKKLNP